VSPAADRPDPSRASRGRHSSGGASGHHCRSVQARPIQRWPPGPASASVAPHQWRNGAANGPSGRAGRPGIEAPGARSGRRSRPGVRARWRRSSGPARRPADRPPTRPDGAPGRLSPCAVRSPPRRSTPGRADVLPAGHGSCWMAASSDLWRAAVPATSTLVHHSLSEGECEAPRRHSPEDFSCRHRRPGRSRLQARVRAIAPLRHRPPSAPGRPAVPARGPAWRSR